MPLEELSPKYFTRERVRNRMLRRAAEIWGYTESEMDDFDPLVTLLLEACAVEFEKISGEIGKTQNRMLERVAQLLYPGTISVSPSYGIIQAVASEPEAVLQTDAQFIYKAGAGDRKRDGQQMEFYFSPSHSSRIVDGYIQYIATSRELSVMEEGMQKRPLATSARKNIEYQHSVWLGFHLNEEIKSLHDISFFFNWINEPESETWYQYLPYTRWFLHGNALQQQPGFPYSGEQDASALETEFDAMKKTEQQCCELFSRHYLRISMKESLEQLKIKRLPCPPAFDLLYDANTLKTLKEPLLWIEVRFPPLIPSEALDTIFCSMNAVPVLERRLNRMNYKPAQHLNIVPLETTGNFLAIKEIVDGQGRSIQLNPAYNPEQLQPHTYTIRYGINRFDERDAYETLTSLRELIKEESAYFSSLGEDFLAQHIRELNQVLARMDDKIKMQQKKQSPYPYLIIRPGKQEANIAIEFWSCHGESANKIPIGSKLVPYRNSHVKTNSLFFIAPTHGGRDKLDDAEKIDRYRSLLLTHNRIVTLEDLKQFTQTQLGKTARSVKYEKKYVASPHPAKGFIQCMQIVIEPQPGSLDEQEWKQLLRELQLKIEKQSANNIPVELRLASNAML